MAREAGGVRRLSSAWTHLVAAVRADHATQSRYDAKYGGRDDGNSVAVSVVKRVGLQLTTAVRVMRFFDEARVPLAPMIMSRVIRHAYGSDIHWKAEIEPGLMVVHGMGMAISPAARIGRGVLLFQNVTLGSGTHPDTHETGAPTIEDDVHIGPGVVIIGPVTIGTRSKIMANSVVTQSVPADSLVQPHASSVKARARAR